MIHTIILFGASGMLGNYVRTFFSSVCPDIKLVIATMRIQQSSLCKLEEYLLSIGICSNVCVINCAGAIPQRNPNDYWIINTVFPHMLASICKRHGAHMIHPSTDCVFSGERGNYIETDVHDGQGDYSKSKSLGEPDCTIIRTSIIGRELYNKTSFMEWVCQNNGNVTAWTNHMWNGITCHQWCKIVHTIIIRKLFWNGVRHIHSPCAYSKYDMACMIADVFQLSSTKVTPALAPQGADKTLQSLYPNEFCIPDLSVQLRELRDVNLTLTAARV